LEFVGEVIQIGFCSLRTEESSVWNRIGEHILSGFGTGERCRSKAVMMLMLGIMQFTVEV
jgi:hypothetical protein